MLGLARVAYVGVPGERVLLFVYLRLLLTQD